MVKDIPYYMEAKALVDAADPAFDYENCSLYSFENRSDKIFLMMNYLESKEIQRKEKIERLWVLDAPAELPNENLKKGY